MHYFILFSFLILSSLSNSLVYAQPVENEASPGAGTGLELPRPPISIEEQIIQQLNAGAKKNEKGKILFIGIPTLKAVLETIQKTKEEKIRGKALSAFLGYVSLKTLADSLSFEESDPLFFRELKNKIKTIISTLKDRRSHWNGEMLYFESLEFTEKSFYLGKILLQEAINFEELFRIIRQLSENFDLFSKPQQEELLLLFQEKLDSFRPLRASQKTLFIISLFQQKGLKNRPKGLDLLNKNLDQILTTTTDPDTLSTAVAQLLWSLRYIKTQSDEAQIIFKILRKISTIELEIDSDEDSDTSEEAREKYQIKLLNLIQLLNQSFSTWNTEEQAIVLEILKKIQSKQQGLVEAKIERIIDLLVNKIWSKENDEYLLSKLKIQITKEVRNKRGLVTRMIWVQRLLLSEKISKELFTQALQWFDELTEKRKKDFSTEHSDEFNDETLHRDLNLLLTIKSDLQSADLDLIQKLSNTLDSALSREEIDTKINGLRKKETADPMTEATETKAVQKGKKPKRCVVQ